VSGAGVRTRRTLVGAGIVALLVTGCGGDSEDAAPVATTAPATTSSSPPSEDGASARAPSHSDELGPDDSGHAEDGDDVPAPGTKLVGENMSAEHAADLQKAVDQGHEPWRLDQSSVATMFTRDRLGWTDVDVALDDPHTVQVTDRTSRHLVSLQMRQPVHEGDTGIWVVDSGVWLG
jgi:hypothetical protein